MPLELQDVVDRDPIEMSTNLPRGQDSRIDEFVDRFATELPAAAQFSDCQPKGTNVTAEAVGVERYCARCRRVGLPAFR